MNKTKLLPTNIPAIIWGTRAIACVLLVCAIFLPTADAWALTHYWGRHPDKERLVLVFPDTIPGYGVKRTGKTTISVNLGEGYWDNNPKPQSSNFQSANLFKNVKVVPTGLEVELRKPDFGYINFPLRDRGKLVIDVFNDPIGGKWKSPEERKKEEEAKAAEIAKPKPETQSTQDDAVPETTEQTVEQTVDSKPQPEVKQEVRKPLELPAKQKLEETSVTSAPEQKEAEKPAPAKNPAQTPAQTPALKQRELQPETAPENKGSEQAATPEPEQKTTQKIKQETKPAVEQATREKVQAPATKKALPVKGALSREEADKKKKEFYSVPYSIRQPISNSKAPATDESDANMPTLERKSSPESNQEAPGDQSKMDDAQNQDVESLPTEAELIDDSHGPPESVDSSNVTQKASPAPGSTGVRLSLAKPGTQKTEPSPQTKVQTAQTPQTPNKVRKPLGIRKSPSQVVAGDNDVDSDLATDEGTVAGANEDEDLLEIPEDNQTPAKQDVAMVTPDKTVVTTSEQDGDEASHQVRQKIGRPGTSVAPIVGGKPEEKTPIVEPETTDSTVTTDTTTTTATADELEETTPGQPSSEADASAAGNKVRTRIGVQQARTDDDSADTEEDTAQEETSTGATDEIVATSPEEVDQMLKQGTDGDLSDEVAEEDALAEEDAEGDTMEDTLEDTTEDTTEDTMVDSAETGSTGDTTLPDGELTPEQQKEKLVEVYQTGLMALRNGDYQNAVDVFEGLMPKKLFPMETREELLYAHAQALLALAKERESLEEDYNKIVSAYTEAMNYNLDSLNVPDALFNLGQVNLRVGSVREAQAYFNILKDKHPDSPNIPKVYLSWGNHFFDQKEYEKAAEQFNYVVQTYPDNDKVTQPAAIKLAETLSMLGLNDAAEKIVDFIETKWDRLYLERPSILRIMGDVKYRGGDLEKAKNSYWTLYNLNPEAKDADYLLAKLGDIYLQTGHTDTAREVYEKTAEKFPDKEGGLVSRMRLAEQGMYDEPTVSEMFSIFDGPYSLQPSRVYTDIVKNYPESPLAPLAQLKLAMWHLWNKQYRDALKDVSDFKKIFPKSELLESAQEVAAQAFSSLVALDIREGNYADPVNMWKQNPILQAQEDKLDGQTKIGLATSFWKQGQPDEALKLIDPFFRSAAMPKDAETALLLALNVSLNAQNWKNIVDLAQKVELWDITPRVKSELEYDLALAYENLKQPDKSAPLWKKLDGMEGIDPVQRGYVLFFLAQNARSKDQLKEAYKYANESLTIFQEHRRDEEKIKDLLLLLVDVTETAGRVRDALKLAIQYSQYINKRDPEWPALRYKMAQLYRKLADTRNWRAILEELNKNNPTGLYGRMAASDLRSQTLEQDAKEFIPSSPL